MITKIKNLKTEEIFDVEIPAGVDKDVFINTLTRIATIDSKSDFQKDVAKNGGPYAQIKDKKTKKKMQVEAEIEAEMETYEKRSKKK